MDRLFPLPAYRFMKAVWKYGGISRKGLRNLPQSLLKVILLEPLRWVELSYNRQVRAHELTADPVFILGYYRSGTSFLHEFLTRDERFGYHTNFQMIFPEIMLGSERFLSPLLDTICRLFDLQDPVHRIPMSFRYPGEEDGAMTASLNPRGAAWGWFFPKVMLEHYPKYVFFEDIPDAEIEAWTRDYIFLLKKISLACGGKPLVLKSPPHTARVKLLLSLFPKARFIFIHRDPYEVYVSNQRFWEVSSRIYALGSTDSVDFNKIILETYAGLMNRYLEDKVLIPKGQLIEVPYRELVQKPMATMRRIYATLQLGDFDQCAGNMKKYVEAQRDYVSLKHTLPLTEREAVTRKLEPFLRHWNYPLR